MLNWFLAGLVSGYVLAALGEGVTFSTGTLIGAFLGSCIGLLIGLMRETGSKDDGQSGD